MAMVQRSYLVVIDETDESAVALRYGARRAKAGGAALRLIRVIAPADFVQWGAVQHAIEAEAREHAQALLDTAADRAEAWTGQRPACELRQGSAGAEVQAAIDADPGVAVLVLGAAAKGAPGPLVSYFSGERAGTLPCPLVIVPGGLDDRRIDALA